MNSQRLVLSGIVLGGVIIIWNLFIKAGPKPENRGRVEPVLQKTESMSASAAAPLASKPAPAVSEQRVRALPETPPTPVSLAEERRKAMVDQSAMLPKDSELSMEMAKKMNEFLATEKSARLAMKDLEKCMTQAPAAVAANLQIFCLSSAQAIAKKYPALNVELEWMIKTANPEALKAFRELNAPTGR